MTRARQLNNCLTHLGTHVETMIQIMMTAYPDDWSEQDKRDAAMAQLKRGGMK